MKIYVASYEDPAGHGSQQVFDCKRAANEWMYKKFVKDYCSGYGMKEEEKIQLFENHKSYGAFSAKIKQFTLSW